MTALIITVAVLVALLLLFMKGADGGEERERPIDPHKHGIDPEAGYDLCLTGECGCGRASA